MNLLCNSKIYSYGKSTKFIQFSIFRRLSVKSFEIIVSHVFSILTIVFLLKEKFNLSKYRKKWGSILNLNLKLRISCPEIMNDFSIMQMKILFCIKFSWIKAFREIMWKTGIQNEKWNFIGWFSGREEDLILFIRSPRLEIYPSKPGF